MDWRTGATINRLHHKDPEMAYLITELFIRMDTIIELQINMEHTPKQKSNVWSSVAGAGLIVKGIAVLILLLLQVPLKDIVLAMMP